jgi:hypothetical protein
MADRREQEQQWYHRFDEKRMVIMLENPRFIELENGDDTQEYDDDELGDGPADNVVPAYFIVCGTCDGKGSHVNPSIDSHGLSREDFDEDPDFAESYFAGHYDVPCHECHGRRVVPDVNLDTLSPAQRKRVEDVQDSFYREQRELEWERKNNW